MSQPERWLPVLGFEDRYEVSDLGRLRPLFSRKTGKYKAGRVKTCARDRDGYEVTLLYREDGSRRQAKVHRIVLETFVGPCPEKMQARHLNGDPGDNRLANLRWGTSLENHADRRRHGTNPRGERNVKARLTSNNVRAIRTRLAANEDRQAIAECFGVSLSAINHIAAGHTWSWLS